MGKKTKKKKKKKKKKMKKTKKKKRKRMWRVRSKQFQKFLILTYARSFFIQSFRLSFFFEPCLSIKKSSGCLKYGVSLVMSPNSSLAWTTKRYQLAWISKYHIWKARTCLSSFKKIIKLPYSKLWYNYFCCDRYLGLFPCSR